MGEIFLEVLNISITASFVILLVMSVRIFLKKLPKIFSYMIWWVVLFRLLCPFSVEGVWSLLPVAKQTIPMEIEMMKQPQINSGIERVDSLVNEVLLTQSIEKSENSVNPMQIWIWVACNVWLLGIAILLLYRIVVIWKLRKKLKMASYYGENIYYVENLQTPFVLGIVRPRIYLPMDINQKDKEYILMHEQMHIKRFDPLVKLVAFFALCIHWFNPLVWATFSLISSDMEMSCDEAVLRKSGNDIKKKYAEILLNLTVEKSTIAGTWVTFGEGNVKARIKNILEYKTVKKGISLLVILAIFLFTVGLMTTQKADPKKERQYEENINQWAQAFCDRDVDTIIKMASKAGMQDLIEQGHLRKEEYYDFGWSSPWPGGMSENYKNYKIINFNESEATILYYALVSDPHITVWEETITYTMENEVFLITSEKLKNFENITTAEEFYKAYPEGKISDTMMDYQKNGLGEVLNQHVLNDNADVYYYQALKNPDTAAYALLNILEGDDMGAVISSFVKKESVAQIEITFLKDYTKIKLQMVQPYGSNGIWVPKDL